MYTHLLGYQKLGNGCPPWPVILIDFAQNPPLECKQLRDPDSLSRINIRFRQSNQSNIWNVVWIK